MKKENQSGHMREVSINSALPHYVIVTTVGLYSAEIRKASAPDYPVSDLEIMQYAELLSAAPDLLSVCERLLDDAVKYKKVQYEAGSFALLHAAVAKARGKI